MPALPPSFDSSGVYSSSWRSWRKKFVIGLLEIVLSDGKIGDWFGSDGLKVIRFDLMKDQLLFYHVISAFLNWLL